MTGKPDLRWFAAGEPEALGAEERQFLSRLAGKLDAVAPAGVDPADTAVRAERGAGDFVVPHRYFRGLALAATVAGTRAEIYWLRVRTLERSDDFDAERGEGWPVFAAEDQGADWMDAAVDHFAAELARPFEVHARFRGRDAHPATVEISVDGRVIWAERHLAAAIPGGRETRFGAAFTTPIHEVERLLAKSAQPAGDCGS